MRQNYLAYATGIILGYIGIVILVPIIAAVFYKEYTSIIPFLSAGLFAMLGGFLVKKSIKPDEIPENLNDIKKAEALFIVASAWVIFGLIAAIPYLFYNLHPLNALFEAVSGITTTGATILTDFNYPHAFFFWRALTQWLGGLGIIVLFIAILPQFAVAGRQMFFAEAPGPIEDKFTPRIRNTASALWKIYTVITVILFILLVWANMPCFDALCTALTTLSAGRFSNNANSIMGYNSFNIYVYIRYKF